MFKPLYLVNCELHLQDVKTAVLADRRGSMEEELKLLILAVVKQNTVASIAKL